jgi:O-antigen/teichoic acid export membrane protein
VTGLPMAASVILLNVQLRADILVLSLLRPVREVGLYDVPFKLYELMYVMPALFGGLMMPFFVRDHDAGRGSLAQRLNAALGTHFVVSLVVFAALYVGAGPVAVLVAGKQFAASAGPLRILAAASVLAGATAILRFGAVARERQREMLWADAAGACSAVCAHLLLIPRYGIIGAAAGKVCGDLVTCGAAMAVLWYELNRTVLIGATTGIIAAFGFIEVASFASDNGVPVLVACGALAPVVFGGVLLVPHVRDLLAALVAPVARSGARTLTGRS